MWVSVMSCLESLGPCDALTGDPNSLQGVVFWGDRYGGFGPVSWKLGLIGLVVAHTQGLGCEGHSARSV